MSDHKCVSGGHTERPLFVHILVLVRTIVSAYPTVRCTQHRFTLPVNQVHGIEQEHRYIACKDRYCLLTQNVSYSDRQRYCVTSFAQSVGKESADHYSYATIFIRVF